MTIGRLRCAPRSSDDSEQSEPLVGIAAQIAGYLGDADTVSFCYEAIARNVDFRRASRSRWSALCPDRCHLVCRDIFGGYVKLPVRGRMRQLVNEAYDARKSRRIFDDEGILAQKVSSIVLLATGALPAEVGRGLSESENGSSEVVPPGLTRLCDEPWDLGAVLTKEGVRPCRRIPPLWDADDREVLEEGLSQFRSSLLSGELNRVCGSCTAKQVATTETLSAHVGPGAVDDDKFFSAIRDLAGYLDGKPSFARPPEHLRLRVSGFSSELAFLQSGLSIALALMHFVEKYDKSTNPTVLDWGSGSGRASHAVLKYYPRFAYVGSDIDREAIDWANENVLKGAFYWHPAQPPTPFEAGQFSSVIAASVMTHLGRNDQALWLEEMNRIVKPGGILVFTTHGPTAALRHAGVAEELASQGILDARMDPALDGVAPSGYYRSVFQTEQYTRRQWSTHFEVVEYVHGGLMGNQDIVVLRKSP